MVEIHFYVFIDQEIETVTHLNLWCFLIIYEGHFQSLELKSLIYLCLHFLPDQEMSYFDYGLGSVGFSSYCHELLNWTKLQLVAVCHNTQTY